MARKEKNGMDNLWGKLCRLPLNLKRTVAVFSAAALIGTAIPTLCMADAQAAVQSQIMAAATAEISIRSGAGTDYPVILSLPQNTSVIVLEKTDAQWLKVQTGGGQTGYCNSEYLEITTDAMTKDYVDLYKGAGERYPKLRTLVPGVRLDVLRFIGLNWIQVRLPDETVGYISSLDAITYLTNTPTETREAPRPSESSGTQQQVTLSISEKSRKTTIGTSFTLKATSSDGKNSFSWKSSNSGVAAVSPSGVVMGVSPGTAVITATDNNSSNTVSCTVTVTEDPLQKITLSESSRTMIIGQTYTLNPTVTPANGKVAYRSSAASVASVSTSGLITAKKTGSAVITVYDPSGGTAQATLKVTVKEKSNITISASIASLGVGNSYKLTASSEDGSAIKWSSSNANVASVRNGVVSGISAGTAVITASDESGSKATCSITVLGVSSSGVSLSRYSSTVTVGKTLYIQGYSSRSCRWASSDSNIASVDTDTSTSDKCFIVGKNPGKAAITFTDSYGNRVVCAVTVQAAEPIRFTYSSPNSATKNANVKLIAITDKNRTAVQFEVYENGKTVTVSATSKVADGNTYVWTGTYKTTAAGTFQYAAYAKTSGSSIWTTCSDGKADIYVSDKTNKTITAVEKLRASDEVIKFIGDKEGFVPNVVPDTLADNIPTMGHGYVVWEGQTFYNWITRSEGYALLVSAVNNDNYTRDVNNMLLSNNVRFNQQQFDALVSFSYNLGTGWTYSSDLKSIVLNCYGAVSNTGKTTASVNADDGLNLRESYTTDSKIIGFLEPNETVTLVSTQKYNSIWYKVQTQSGQTGYCSGTYLTIHPAGSSGRDLNYISKNAFITEMLAYHHAGGVCYYGLLYRRADEVEMFLYGDYLPDGSQNKYGFPSPYCLSF